VPVEIGLDPAAADVLANCSRVSGLIYRRWRCELWHASTISGCRRNTKRPKFVSQVIWLLAFVVSCSIYSSRCTETSRHTAGARNCASCNVVNFDPRKHNNKGTKKLKEHNTNHDKREYQKKREIVQSLSVGDTVLLFLITLTPKKTLNFPLGKQQLRSYDFQYAYHRD